MHKLVACVALLAGCGSGVDNLATSFALVGESREGRLAVLSALDAWRLATLDVTAGVGEPHQATISVVDEGELAPLLGVTLFEEARLFVTYTGDYEETRRVALHEIGHWFSWSDAHSSDPRDVMFEYARANAPTPADVARLR